MTAFSLRPRIISASSSSARARSNDPRRRTGRSGRRGGWACEANGSWWRAAQSTISNIVKTTIATGTGCARTRDWIAPSPDDSSAPLGGVSAQTSADASTMGNTTNQRPQ